MINKVYKFISENQILEHGDSVVLGVSGGADSMCMLHVLYALKDRLDLTLSVIHVNHNIRGKQAQRDQEYVRDVCDKLNIPCVIKSVDVLQVAKEQRLTEEEAGRKVRYNLFEQERKKISADKIAVAHNLNDNSETIMFHLLRGTGIKGLTGIPVKRDRVVRPLLCCTRKEIEEYLNACHIGYCDDYTNNETNYSRNKLRLEVFPYLKENINSKAEYNIVNAANNLSDIYDFVLQQSEDAYSKYVKKDSLSTEAFHLHPAILNEIIKKMIEKEAGQLKDITKTHIESVRNLMDNSVSKKVCLPYNLVAVRDYKGISIRKEKFFEDKKNQEEILMKEGEIFQSDFVDMSFVTGEFNIENIPEMVYTKWIDCDKIHTLSLRNRMPGDYLMIDDKGNRKKLKEYFINEKIPREERDNVLLLADGSHIVWIIGHRISSYYKVTDTTSKILKVEYRNNN